MSAPSKRANRSASAQASAPLVNTLLVGAALAYGLWLLVAGGRLSWPPSELLTGAYTLAGCMALIGPFLLGRRQRRNEGALGELAWMCGGALVWIYNLAAIVRGTFRPESWATPLSPQTMGLTMLAVLLAGLRLQGAGRSWSWTNVVGWLLGLFWIGIGLTGLFSNGSKLLGPELSGS